MEEEMRALLLEGETLLWSGRPEPFDTLDKTNKKSIVIGIIIKAFVAGLFLALYLSSSMRDETKTNTGLVALVIAIAAFAIYFPFLTARHMRKKTLFGLTDRRVLRAGLNTGSVPYERIKKAVLRKDADGHTTLLCGSQTIKLKPHQWRNAADAAFIDRPDEAEAERVILYAIPMNDELSSLLHQFLPINDTFKN